MKTPLPRALLLLSGCDQLRGSASLGSSGVTGWPDTFLIAGTSMGATTFSALARAPLRAWGPPLLDAQSSFVMVGQSGVGRTNVVHDGEDTVLVSGWRWVGEPGEMEALVLAQLLCDGHAWYITGWSGAEGNLAYRYEGAPALAEAPWPTFYGDRFGRSRLWGSTQDIDGGTR